MKKNCFKLIVSIAFLAFALNATARENIGSTGSNNANSSSNANNRSVNSQCVNATAQIDLDINNVRAKILNGGDMWWDIFGTTNARYYVPKPANNQIGPSSQFASSVWIGGYDAGGNLKEAAQTYRQSGNDYWPGPLYPNGTTDGARCLTWDRFFKVNKADVVAHYNWCVGGEVGPDPITVNPSLSDAVDELTNWPAFGPEGQPLAPFYDFNGDGLYNFSDCDVPGFNVTGSNAPCNNQYLFGDQCIFWVFNDKGNIHTETQGQAIGVEIQAQAFGFQTTDALNDATFYKYKIINKSSFRVDSTFFGIFDDFDLGWYADDFTGCDVGLGLGIGYNGLANDGPGTTPSYGANPPAVGVDFFEGPYKDPNNIDDPAASVPASFLGYGDSIKDNERLGMCRFMYFNNNTNAINGNPGAQSGGSSDDYYQYLSGTWKNGTPMTYGSDGTHAGNPKCKYMFPGSSDPTGFGTAVGSNFTGPVQTPWDETTSNNTPADRRFVESAGPFTLQPGAVNYITIGVPWARTTTGGNLASVELMKGADAKAQLLFNNCFASLDGPTAPSLTIQELDKKLVLFWSNPKGSNNHTSKNDEDYHERYDKLSNIDSMYRFQGYIVYQLKDGSVGATDLYNVDKARIVFQCDKKDGIGQIVNYYNDVTLHAMVPQDMVDGADAGISHSCSVSTDLFATGNNQLINHKTYYYTIIAYGYSPTYNPTNLNILNDYLPFIAGRLRSDPTFYHTAIPHIPESEHGGTVQQSDYGTGPQLIRIEGQGNGGNVLDMTQGSVDEMMNPATGYRALYPQYENSAGPVKIQVVDPLNVPVNNSFRFILHPVGAGGITSASRWDLINLDTHDTIHSETSIKTSYEQLICGQDADSANVKYTLLPKWGMSVNVVFINSPGVSSPVNNGFLEATMSFADNSKIWLAGVPDGEGDDYHNWIRSGTYTDATDIGFNDEVGQDDGQNYEKLIGGTWAPYRLCAKAVPTTGAAAIIYRGGPRWIGNATPILRYISSVDVIITADRSKWTRCPVIELQENSALAIGNAKKMGLRASPSVDKYGSANYPSADNNDAATGMGWFPGYAINLETGERLNMAFGEDSWEIADNGGDMIWNPTSTDLSTTDGTPVFGGKHYIYVFGHNLDQVFSGDVNFPDGTLKSIQRYDQGKLVHDLLSHANMANLSDTYARLVYSDAMWVNIPLLATSHSLLECDVKIRLRVGKAYNPGFTTSTDVVTGSTPINNNYPVYDFGTSDIGTETNNANAASKALDLINVVPNPYYAYSGYEQATSDNIVKITNLPEKCTVTIYTISGTLIRTYNVDQSTLNVGNIASRDIQGVAVTSLVWDLKNQVRIPIASGLYIIHIDVPDVGEKTIKWFGVIRPLDLDSY